MNRIKDATIRRRTEQLYNTLPAHIKEDICYTAPWARETLRDLEGSGHSFHLFGDKDRMVVCSFDKPQWPSDFCGIPMEDGCEAMAVAVCEYLAWQEVENWKE